METNKSTIRVMLIEDNPEYRDVIALALEDEPDIDLISQFGTSEIALRALRDPLLKVTPDIILLDLRLPGMDGLDSISPLLASALHSRIIILTQSNQEADVLRAISLGASGYLLKSTTLDQLTQSVRTVMDGGAALDAGVAKFILDTIRGLQGRSEAEPILSEREIEIITLLAEGLVKKQIASQLKIGYSTVDTHVSRIYEKLHVSNAPSAVDKAHRLGIFSPDADT